ncbi:MAG TPA: M14 family zinc carboxypeptidase [Bacteroidia bacterium]|nr:M14 family zinc carboxypeptidase [Bacteroidia bacterium]
MTMATGKYKWLFTCIIHLLVFSCVCGQDVKSLNESNQSVTWSQALERYKNLAAKYDEAELFEAGLTDCGKPLNFFVISKSKVFDPVTARQKGYAVVLINNGIHAGEPDGIDACIRISESYLKGNLSLPENVVIVIIPVFNIDGSLNRGCCSRANQNGPEQYGFRGNSRNLDLNRDFIKCDAENTRSFIKLFREWDPDVFIDTHVSDGADYPYVMTLISTQHDKLGGAAGKYLYEKMTPALFKNMETLKSPMTPYVNTLKYDDDPSEGIYAYSESARYTTGYAALFQSFSFVTETHMLKPFAERVKSTISFIRSAVEFTALNAAEIQRIRKQTRAGFRNAETMGFNFKVDTAQFDTINFRGYTAEIRKSPVTYSDQLYYDRNKPYTRPIRYYNHFVADDTVQIPKQYIVPQAWKEVVERLKLNQVQMNRVASDTIVTVSAYVIDDVKTVTEPYEGHYLHKEVNCHIEKRDVQLFAGDYVVPTDQDAVRYIVEALEPASTESFFAWGFFDSILQQKEWFSAYVFDDKAREILEGNKELKEAFEAKRATDPVFASDAFAQLYFIYKSSPYFEKSFHVYPVYRIMR